MLFPAPSETFASLDVRELTHKGVDVEVHSLRAPSRSVDQLAVERGLAGVPRSYNGPLSNARGLAVMLRRPVAALSLIGELIRTAENRRTELLKALVLVPRVFDIFYRLIRHPPQVVHIYWGHYPAMVGMLVQRYLPEIRVSMSLGAYDLAREFPLTATVAKNAVFVRTHGKCNIPTLVDHVGVEPGKVAVIYNGVDLALVPQDVLNRKRVRGRIVTVGRLDPGKAFGDVIEVFAQVSRRFPEATMQIFGEGPDRARLESLAADQNVASRVSFEGHQPQARIFKALADAEVFLFMSQNERLPNVVKEAMACGAVCVATDTLGIDELIVDPEYGFVVPVGDVPSAVCAVIQALERPDRLSVNRAKARRHIVDHFDVVNTSEEYVMRWRAAVDERDANGID